MNKGIFEKQEKDWWKRNYLLTAFMLVLGLGLIAGYFWSRYPDKFKKILGIE